MPYLYPEINFVKDFSLKLVVCLSKTLTDWATKISCPLSFADTYSSAIWIIEILVMMRGLKFRFYVAYILVCTKQNVRIDWIEFCTKKTYAFNLNSKHCPLVFSHLHPRRMLWLLRNLRGNWTLNISRNFLLKIHILEKPSLWILCQECKLKPVQCQTSSYLLFSSILWLL